MSCEGPTQVGSGSGGFNAGGLILLALHYIQQKTEDYSEDEVAKKLYYQMMEVVVQWHFGPASEMADRCAGNRPKLWLLS